MPIDGGIPDQQEEEIALCSGHNELASLSLLAPRINVEIVLSADAELIVTNAMDVACLQSLDDWREFPRLADVRDKHPFFVPPKFRSAARHAPACNGA